MTDDFYTMLNQSFKDDIELLTMAHDCMARESKLTEWEQNFIQDCTERLESCIGLYPRQADKLNEIWEKVTA